MRPQIPTLALVSGQLQAYARRGVFRSFSQTRAEGMQGEFRFYWLWNLSFRLTFDARRKALSFKNLLPNVPPRSALNAELKAFIKEQSSRRRLEHRRLDPNRLSVRYSNMQGTVSITFLVMQGDYQYGVKKALSLINEIFVGFLNVNFPEYTAAHFHKRED